MAQILRVSSKGIAIGRDSKNDVIVRNPYVSRFHAFVIFSNRGLTIIDRDSANGTELSLSGSDWIKVNGIETVPFIDGTTKIRLAGADVFDLIPEV